MSRVRYRFFHIMEDFGMESKEKKARRKAGKRLAAVCMLSLLGVYAALEDLAFAEDIMAGNQSELTTFLGTSQDTAIGFSGHISLGSTLEIGTTNTIDLLGQKFTQNGHSLKFAQDGTILTIKNDPTDEAFAEDINALNDRLVFTSFKAAEDSARGTIVLDGMTQNNDAGFELDGVNLTLTNGSSLVLEKVTVTEETDENGETVSKTSSEGKPMTQNNASLVVDGLSSLYAGSHKVSGSSDIQILGGSNVFLGDFTATVPEGETLSIKIEGSGEIPAQKEGDKPTVQNSQLTLDSFKLESGSQGNVTFDLNKSGVLFSEKALEMNESVTMNVAGGYAQAKEWTLDGTTVNLTEGGQFIGIDKVDLTLRDGGTLNVDGGSNFFAGDPSNDAVTGTMKITAAEGSATVNATGNSQIYGTNTLDITANADTTLTFNISGTENTNGSVTLVSSISGTYVGGEGTVDMVIGDYGSIGSCSDMVFGTTEGGTVNFTMKGANAFSITGIASNKEEDMGQLTIGQHGTVNMTIGDGAFMQGLKQVSVASNEDANVTLTLDGGYLRSAEFSTDSSGNTSLGGSSTMILGDKGTADVTLKNKGSLISSGDMIVGKDGLAQVSGSGTVSAGGKLVVGQNANDEKSTLSLKNSYVEAAGIVVGEAEGSSGSFKLTGDGSMLYVSGLEETLSAAGEGSVTIDGLNLTKDGQLQSYVHLEDKAQIVANDGITVKDSYIYAAGNAFLNGGSKGVRFSNSIVNNADGNLQTVGDTTFTSGSTYVAGLGTDGSANALKVNDGSLKIEDGAKLEVYFTDSGAITGTDWTIAEVDSENANDKITGDWDITTQMDIYTFAKNEELSTDQKYVLTSTLRKEFFTVRANSLQLARQSLWTAVDDRISWNACGQAYCGERSPLQQYDLKSSFWAKAGYRGLDVKGAGGYNIDAFNMTVGADCAFEEYFAAGAFFNFSSPEMEGEHETADASNYSFGVYGGYRTWHGIELRGTFAYTFSKYDLMRNMGYSGWASTDFYGSGLTASVEVARPFTFGNLILRPIFAVDTECVWQDEAVESGSYALQYGKLDDTWTFARLGAKVDFAPTQRLNLRGKLFYAIQLDDQGATEMDAQFAGTYETVHLVGAKVADDYFNLGLSASYMWSDKLTLFTDYDGFFANEAESHLVHGGFQINF
ncbi:MAG: autotransporter domain-containing protein [Planctomycetaceae bacterium]|nr:autotransporter domain-containing protein [Planctomycetaceae bacterium]